MKKNIGTVCCALVILVFSMSIGIASVINECIITFSDVPPDFWAREYIKALYCSGIATGYPDNTYRPAESVSRAQMAAFLIRAKYGETFTYSTAPYFNDIPESHWAFKYIQKMYDEGITTGYADGTYRPSENVTRGQMATFIIRTLFGESFSYTSTPYFSDISDSHWAFKYVQKMYDESITTGYPDGTYRPSQNVSRAQMAAFIARAFPGIAGVTFSFVDEPADIPSGVTGEVDNEAQRLRVVGIANPNTSRYVTFMSNSVPYSNISTIIFEADITLPTGLRHGILTGDDITGDGGLTNGIKIDSMGTPVLFRVEFTSISFVEISMLSHFGLALEQVINLKQPSNEISLNGGLARTYTAITKWSGGKVIFDPLGLIDEGSMGAQFHAKISIDLEQNKVMAEIIPYSGLEYKFNPLPVGSYGAIANPFIAVTNLIDYSKDSSFQGNIQFKAFVRTNGNTDVDNTQAPGGTLRYIDREFENVQVTFNKPIEFPPVPQIQLPSDDFDDMTIAAFWDWLSIPATGLLLKEENGILHLSGTPIDEGSSGSSLLTIAYPRQDVTAMIDFRAPTGIQIDTFCLFRIQFDYDNYLDIVISNGGYQLARVIDSQVETVGGQLPLFGDETTIFHKLKLSYNDSTGHVEAYIDDIQLDGIADRVFSSSFNELQLGFFSFSVGGQYIEREWDNFISLGENQ